MNLLHIVQRSSRFNKPVKHALWRHTHPRTRIHWRIWLQPGQALHKLLIHKPHSLHSIAGLLKKLIVLWLLPQQLKKGESPLYIYASHHKQHRYKLELDNRSSCRNVTGKTAYQELRLPNVKKFWVLLYKKKTWWTLGLPQYIVCWHISIFLNSMHLYNYMYLAQIYLNT